MLNLMLKPSISAPGLEPNWCNGYGCLALIFGFSYSGIFYKKILKKICNKAINSTLTPVSQFIQRWISEILFFLFSLNSILFSQEFLLRSKVSIVYLHIISNYYLHNLRHVAFDKKTDELTWRWMHSLLWMGFFKISYSGWLKKYTKFLIYITRRL